MMESPRGSYRRKQYELETRIKQVDEDIQRWEEKRDELLAKLAPVLSQLDYYREERKTVSEQLRQHQTLSRQIGWVMGERP